MTASPDSLAIETASRATSVTVGRGDDILRTVTLTQQRRHNLELIPAINELCTPAQLKHVYVDVGPGSFTGLRIAVATAKMLALTLGVKLVAVETVDVLAAQHPDHEHLLVCVNHKRDTVYARRYHHGNPTSEAELANLIDLLAAAPRPLAMVCDVPGFAPPAGVTVLPDEPPRSDVLWRIGRERASMNLFADPATILPRYARPPEAVTLWEARKKES